MDRVHRPRAGQPISEQRRRRSFEDAGSHLLQHGPDSRGGGHWGPPSQAASSSGPGSQSTSASSSQAAASSVAASSRRHPGTSSRHGPTPSGQYPGSAGTPTRREGRSLSGSSEISQDLNSRANRGLQDGEQVAEREGGRRLRHGGAAVVATSPVVPSPSNRSPAATASYESRSTISSGGSLGPSTLAQQREQHQQQQSQLWDFFPQIPPAESSNSAHRQEEPDEEEEERRALALEAQSRGLQRRLEMLQQAMARAHAVMSRTVPREPAQVGAPVQREGPQDQLGQLHGQLQQTQHPYELWPFNLDNGLGWEGEEEEEEEDEEEGEEGEDAIEGGLMEEIHEVDDEEMVHPGISCDGCGAGPPLYGEVMKCMDCPDFDFCAACYRQRNSRAHPLNHRFQARSTMRYDSANRRQMALALLAAMEEDMLLEAMQRSTLSDVDGLGVNPPVVDPAVRATEIVSCLHRVKWTPGMMGQSGPGHVEEDGDVECALCLEEYNPGEEVLQLPCGHIFHEACVTPWFMRSTLCPMCKQDVQVASSA